MTGRQGRTEGEAPASAIADRGKAGWPHRTPQPLRHEHVEIAGYAVEVTEDEIGVVELHLE